MARARGSIPPCNPPRIHNTYVAKRQHVDQKHHRPQFRESFRKFSGQRGLHGDSHGSAEDPATWDTAPVIGRPIGRRKCRTTFAFATPVKKITALAGGESRSRGVLQNRSARRAQPVKMDELQGKRERRQLVP